MAYIHYDKKPNGAVYASVYESYRDRDDGGKTKTRRIENLGRVVDRDNLIFRQKGALFQYVIGEGRREVPESVQTEPVVPEKESMILDFGDGWFLREYLSRQPFHDCFLNVLPDESDTVIALVFYRLLTSRGAGCHAKIWYEGNYSYLAYPRANLTSQNISRVLKKLGSEEVQRRFFREYMSCIYGESGAAGILVDSTGVPNATKMDVTQISNHNGEISREVRLIYVIDRTNGMPIYFRHVAGNIIDVSTLITTVNELEQYGVAVSHAILDAGYYSEKNASALFESGISFMTRLGSNKPAFREAAEGNLEGLMSQKYAHRYGERLVFIRKVPVSVCGHEAFVYLCIDEDMYLMQHKKTILQALDDKKDHEETDAAVRKLGTFAILTSDEIAEDDLLPLYYTRQKVEQVFDITKNYADLLPIRVQSEQSFAGHLLISFMATAIMQKLQQELLKKRSKKAKQLNAQSIFGYLRNQKCKVFTNYAIPQENRKEANDIYDIFKVQVPSKIPLTKIEL